MNRFLSNLKFPTVRSPMVSLVIEQLSILVNFCIYYIIGNYLYDYINILLPIEIKNILYKLNVFDKIISDIYNYINPFESKNLDSVIFKIFIGWFFINIIFEQLVNIYLDESSKPSRTATIGTQTDPITTESDTQTEYGNFAEENI